MVIEDTQWDQYQSQYLIKKIIEIFSLENFIKNKKTKHNKPQLSRITALYCNFVCVLWYEYFFFTESQVLFFDKVYIIIYYNIMSIYFLYKNKNAILS